jgi:hypothetical protein
MPLIIWFDDGLIEHYTIAFPLMQNAGLKGSEAVITGHVGDVWNDIGYRLKPCMTLEQLTELHNAGWDLFSHSVTHPYFSQITADQAFTELTDSQTWIKSQGFEGYCFVWPFGDVGHQDIEQQHYSYERSIISDIWDGKNRDIPLTVMVNHQNPIAPAVDDAISKAQTGYSTLLFAHGIRTLDEERDPWEITPDECASIIDQIKNSEVKVVTLSEALKSSSPNNLIALASLAVLGLTITAVSL